MKDYGPIDAHQMENYPPHAFNSSNNTTSKTSSLVKPMVGASNSRIPNPHLSSAATSGFVQNNTASSSPSKMPQPGVARSKSTLTSASGIGSGKHIPTLNSGISSRSLNPASKIPPPTNSAVKISALQKAGSQPLPQGCSVKPLPKSAESASDASKTETDPPSGPSSISIENCPARIPLATTSENDEATAMMTASFHSRTCSLPRQKRLGREDGSPGPSCVNVAVVSPMPTTKSPKVPKTQNKTSDDQQKDDNLHQPKDLVQGTNLILILHKVNLLPVNGICKIVKLSSI
jgi:hypothetical protein